jgi:hypothetical protein
VEVVAVVLLVARQAVAAVVQEVVAQGQRGQPILAEAEVVAGVAPQMAALVVAAS